jgi:4-diphosphocytidyl-2-C-methyl-D-erythritol kinase
MATRVRSHAKINLGLHIGPPRADGFHALVTVYQTLEVHDFVTVTAHPSAKTAITLTTNDKRVPTDNRNTAWKAAEALLDRFEVAAEVVIHIEKQLPVQGGLGAGSANAVAALVGVERELAKDGIKGLTGAERLELAAEIGSDVPLFLIGGSVLGLNRGEEVYPLPDLPPIWCTVATPAVGVSTPLAFRDWDALCAAGLESVFPQGLKSGEGMADDVRAEARTLQSEARPLQNDEAEKLGGSSGLTPTGDHDRLKGLSRQFASAFSGTWAVSGSSGVSAVGGDQALLNELVRTGIENDFERVVFRQHPFLYEIKQTLLGSPEAANPHVAAIYAALSGSGSALFGLYSSRLQAEAALARLKAMSVEGFVTRTLPRADYWQGMLERPASSH